MSPMIRIGTRGSRLALWQAELVAGKLKSLGVESIFEVIQTMGDQDQNSDFGAIGAKGVFVKEIETALLERRIDLAVHSLKDLPTELSEGLVLGAAMERESPYDGLVSREGMKLDQLPLGATIATGSLRRAAQVLAMRRDLQILPLRGNVPTRVRKIQEGSADATLLALAGLRRLDMEKEIAQVFSPDQVTPSMGQGAIGIESRSGEFADLLKSLDHAPTRRAIESERLFISRIGGGCKTPAGVLAEPISNGNWKITAVLSSPDGKSLLRHSREATNADDLNPAALQLADQMLAHADAAIRATLHP